MRPRIRKDPTLEVSEPPPTPIESKRRKIQAEQQMSKRDAKDLAYPGRKFRYPSRGHGR